MAVCSEIHAKHVNTLWEQNTEFLYVKTGIHEVSLRLEKVKDTNFGPDNPL